MPTYDYYKNIFKDLQHPLAYVDVDLLDENIHSILARAKQKQIRLASKSIRCTAVLKHILNSSKQFQGIMTFSAQEVVMLSQQGFDDLLMGYPIMNLSDLNAIAQEIENGKQIVLMVDKPVHLQIIQQAADVNQQQFKICIDLDLSIDYPGLHFGVWRSSITNMQQLQVFLEEIKKYNGVELVGLMGYEAQVAGVGNQQQGQALKNKVIQQLQKSAIKKIAAKRAKAIDIIKKEGFNLILVNGGGTGSIESTIEEDVVTEVTVGSGFYNSHLFDNYHQFQHQPAAGFALQITRNPKANIYTCAGGGYIASGAIEQSKAPKPYLPHNCKLDKLEGAGEVQTPIHYAGQQKLNIGDSIFFRHAKAGELCERFNSLHLIKNGQIIDEVKTYRGQGYCFL